MSQNMIVGTTATNMATNSYAYAYLYDGVSVHNLGTLQGGLTSSASDINDAGNRRRQRLAGDQLQPRFRTPPNTAPSSGMTPMACRISTGW